MIRSFARPGRLAGALPADCVPRHVARGRHRLRVRDSRTPSGQGGAADADTPRYSTALPNLYLPIHFIHMRNADMSFLDTFANSDMVTNYVTILFEQSATLQRASHVIMHLIIWFTLFPLFCCAQSSMPHSNTKNTRMLWTPCLQKSRASRRPNRNSERNSVTRSESDTWNYELRAATFACYEWQRATHFNEYTLC